MAFSTYYGNYILDQKLTGTVSLHTADPTGTGAVAEVVGGSYARQAVTYGSASGKANSNTGTVTFADMPACTVTHFVFWDGSANPIFVSPLSSPFVVAAGQTLSFAAGELANQIT